MEEYKSYHNILIISKKTRQLRRVSISSGGRIRTADLRVMSPTEY